MSAIIQTKYGGDGDHLDALVFYPQFDYCPHPGQEGYEKCFNR
jgi:hypothetical protein